ncbi:MAG: hypothetical protein QM790_04750 [Nibricoccus sp.]
MPLQLVTVLRLLRRFAFAAVFFAIFANGASASTRPGAIGSGSLDDWLALGLAMLAALYCVQKRE